MCFSAMASFSAAGVVGVAGATAVRSAARPSHLVLAAIPVFFALHQASEGVLWLALTGAAPRQWAGPAMYGFQIVAEVVWPTLVPLAVLSIEGRRDRRRIVAALLGLGIGVSIAQAYGLVAFPVRASIEGYHIGYRLDSPAAFMWATDLAYLLVTVLPPFVSSARLMRWAGALVAASLVLSKLLFYDTFISVWCFFAALISALLVLIIRRSARSARSWPTTSTSLAR